jgi:hypothetical protein
LASEELESKINKVLEKQYHKLKFTLQVQEEHHIEILGVKFDFFTPNPKTRLEKNYFLAELSLEDTGRSNETMTLLDEIASTINTELSGTPKQLSLEIYVKDPKNAENTIQRFYINGIPRDK